MVFVRKDGVVFDKHPGGVPRKLVKKDIHEHYKVRETLELEGKVKKRRSRVKEAEVVDCEPVEIPSSELTLEEALHRLGELEREYQALGIQELKIRSLDDFYLFTTEVLGYELIRSDDDARNPSKIVCNWLAGSGNDAVMVLLPRDCFKSTICTVSYPLWRLCKEPDFRWLIMMETYSKACDKLREIKGHIDGSNARSKFKAVFGDWQPKRKNLRWSEDEVDFTIRKMGYAEASITAMGVDGSPTGKHFDGHILDDPCSDKTSQNQESLQGVIRKASALWGTLSSTGGKVIYVGTRWDDGDLYGYVMDTQCDVVDTPWHGGWSYDKETKGYIKVVDAA